MLSIFKKTGKNKGLSSISLMPGGFAFSRIFDNKARPPKGDICEFCACKDFQLLGKNLTDFVAKHGLQKTNCNVVLHPAYYRLLLIDAPKTPKAEYKQAIPWQIKDMVDLPLDDISIDIFSPDQDIPELRDKIYVVAACKSFLQDMVGILCRAQLNPVTIDIHELAMRNLLGLPGEDSKPKAFLHLLSNRSLLLIVKGGEICFARRIMFGLQKMRDGSALKKIAAEVARCFNYYQSHLEQPLPDNIFFAPILSRNDFIAEGLKQELKMNVKPININELVSYPQLLPENIQAYCSAAIGGALRN